MNRRRIIALLAGVGVLLLAIIIIVVININKSDDGFSVRGVDLSAYQGTIDWEVLAQQNIDFAFIKATEGVDYTDSQFENNWEESQKTDLKVGAYLFLNFDVTGKEQAEHYIDTVKMDKNNLPPVIDLELYGGYNDEPLSQEEVQVILNETLLTLEDYYGVKPIIYTTPRIFRMYLGEGYLDYKIWIVDLDNSWPETLPNGEEFTFWQFSHRGMMDGYDGDEIFIDMNYYNGSYDEFIDEFF